MKFAAALTCALVLAVPAFAQTPPPIDPRSRAEAVAAAIEAEYFDPAKAAKIAADLRREAEAGAFDHLRDPRDFAGAMTARLRPLDGHFAVQWEPPRAGRPAPRGFDPVAFEAMAKRNNHGFRSVEVLPGNIGYVDMRMFAHFEGGDGPARAKADAVMALLADTDAVIFDLRDNGGGSPAMVGYLVNHFVPAGADVYNTFKGRGPDQYERPTAEPRGQRRLEVPVLVVTSGRTASAAESFAYTLQAAKRATVVGEATAGGANPGGTHPVGEGLSIFISFGTPVNPITKANWEGSGVIPDVAVPASEALARAQALALKRLAERPAPEPVATENRWVLEALERPPAAAGDLQAYVGTYGALSIARTSEGLELRQGRRPPVALVSLDGEGLFTAKDAPLRRFRFERPAGGGPAEALVTLSPDGVASRHLRSAAVAAASEPH
ncbi:MAG: S41 family peptidase [Phenylobacterium sp.]|uniref:S41 family peptidase n=1 Tax=Phenylobacterium sp. TaxID=1871053 RepID=UPI00391B847D